MFELLSDIRSIPIEQDSLTMVHRGMNKVRVSVGDHISEPSEVYIITGRTNGNLESYVIFYMLEPGINVVYSCDQNPYEPAMKDQIIEEAVIFVEEMGSILEEVPWGTMTPEQRASWIEKEILYKAPVIEELEEVEEIEELEVVEMKETEPEETAPVDSPGLDPESGVVEVSEDELQQALSDSGLDTTPAGPVEADDVSTGNDLDKMDFDGDDPEGMEDVVVAEGDFDELLKQAFLKPDVAEKTKKKGGRKKTAKGAKEKPVREEIAVEDSEELAAEETAEGVRVERSGEVDEVMETGDEAERTPLPVEEVAQTVDPSTGAKESVLSEKDTRLKVIRFLSRF